MIRILNTVATQPAAPTVHRVWATNSARNLMAAVKARDEYHRDVVAANGNASVARTWVEVDGRAVDAGPAALLDTADCTRILAGLQ